MIDEAYNQIQRINKFREERNLYKSKLKNITNEINSGYFYGTILENKKYYKFRFQQKLNQIKAEISSRKDRIDRINENLQINLKDIEHKNYEMRQKITQRQALQGRIKEYTVHRGHTELNKFDNVLNGEGDDDNDDNDNALERPDEIIMLSNILKDISTETILNDYNNAAYNADVVNIQMSIKFEVTTNSDDGNQYRYANSDTFLMTSKDTINECVLKTIEQFFKVLDSKDSETHYHRILHFRWNISHQKKKLFRQPNAGSYIPLTDKVANSKSCINVKNLDDKCIEYCIIGFLFHDELAKTKKLNDPTRYNKYFDRIKRPDNITYPINLGCDVKPYERLNDLCINIYQIMDNNTFINVYESPYNKKLENRHLNLLLITDDKKENSHLVWIKDFSRFSSHFVINKKKKTYVCEHCLMQQFTTKEQCAEHYTRCIKNIQTKVKLPKKGSVMKFTNDNREFQHPFFCTADFESTLLPIKEDDTDNTEFLKRYQKHVPNSYGLKFNCMHDKHSLPVKINTNPNPEILLKEFVEDLENYAKNAYKLTKTYEKINDPNFTRGTDLYIKHKKATQCTRCSHVFDNLNTNIKVAHHDHINGQFISTLCENCNKKYRYKKFLPVILHNLKGYDSHLFIKALYKYGYVDTKKDNVISCIPNTEQQYISFSKNIFVDNFVDCNGNIKDIMYEIRFIDSFSFMASSIEKIADSIKGKYKEINPELIQKWRKSFKYTSEHFKNDDQFITMISKGIYPYDYIDSYDKLNTTSLPPSKDFYSKLNNSSISTKDYETATNNYKILECKTFMDYHKYYLTSDVLLLTDIWNNFIKKSLDAYSLDPSYYYTAPSLSWDAFLKSATIDDKPLELELLTDIDKFNFVEKGIRGGLSQISTRYARANNEDIKNPEYQYNKDMDTSQIFYLDANNLYGHSMTQYLPYKNFEWNNDTWTVDNIVKLGDEDNIGYLFEVDLSIHPDLHDYFNNYTPLPINKKVNVSDINQKYTKNITKITDKTKSLYRSANITKLCCDLSPRKKYIVHYRMLKLALNLGFTLDKVHRVLKFNQAPFMKSYILKNTEFRTKAVNDFEKDFFKLLNNSAYGKTMENVRNRIDFKLINSQKQLDKAKRLKRFTIFDENSNLIGLHLSKCSVTLNKPIYIGQCVLDDSKHLMFDFHYNFMHKHVGLQNFNLLFTDTDSLCYHIKNNNFYDIMDKNRKEFDLSDFPENHRLHDNTNKKVIGKFKVEYSGIELIEFIGLRSKVYSILKDKPKDQESKKLKGIKKYVVENEITHQKYLDTLRTGIDYYTWQNSIRTFKHQIYSITQKKKALSRSDDKVYICDDNIHTYTHGHKNIPIDNNNI